MFFENRFHFNNTRWRYERFGYYPVFSVFKDISRHKLDVGLSTGKDTDNSGSASYFFVESLQGVRRADFPFVEGREVVELQTVLQALQKARNGLRKAILVFCDQHAGVLSCTVQVWLEPDLLEFLGKAFLLLARNVGQDVSHEVHFTSLPLASQQASFYCRLDPFMGI